MDLIDFILGAKRSGYAGQGRKKEFDDGSAGFEILSGRYRYMDRYHGFNPFAGSEQVFDSGQGLIWVMNYFGEVLPDGAESEKIYAFLREAMGLVSPQYPFRGPSHLESGKFRYENLQHGSLDRFHGIESIYQNGEKVYLLYYHGGLIQKGSVRF